MKARKRILDEACAELSVEREFVVHCIREHWVLPITPPDPEEQPEHVELDDEDLARVRLIRDLRELFEVNDAAIPVILRLIDQLIAVEDRLAEAEALLKKRSGIGARTEGPHRRAGTE